MTPTAPSVNDVISTQPVAHQAQLTPSLPGLCDCSAEIGLCCLTYWCPCITFYNVEEKLGKGLSWLSGFKTHLYTIISIVWIPYNIILFNSIMIIFKKLFVKIIKSALEDLLLFIVHDTAWNYRFIVEICSWHYPGILSTWYVSRSILVLHGLHCYFLLRKELYWWSEIIPDSDENASLVWPTTANFRRTKIHFTCRWVIKVLL